MTNASHEKIQKLLAEADELLREESRNNPGHDAELHSLAILVNNVRIVHKNLDSKRAKSIIETYMTKTISFAHNLRRIASIL